MASHSSSLAWRIPQREEPGGLQSMGSQESDLTEATEHTHARNQFPSRKEMDVVSELVDILFEINSVCHINEGLVIIIKAEVLGCREGYLLINC